MKRRGIQFTARHRWWFYSVASILFLSGAAWSGLGWLADRDGAEADTLRSLKPWLMKIHGAVAMAFLVELGYLIPTHLKRAWHAHRNRGSGGGFFVVVFLLIVTGYGLYYFGDDRWRAAASWIHFIFGLASPILLAWHIWLGRRS